MEKTLTKIGIEKISRRFVNSIDHAAYTIDGVLKTIKPFRIIAQDGFINIYIYFDDTISGIVANVQLVDTDGDVVAMTDRAFKKPLGDGLYVAFKYIIAEKKTEVETTSGNL